MILVSTMADASKVSVIGEFLYHNVLIGGIFLTDCIHKVDYN